MATISFFRILEFKIDGLIKALENDRKPNLTDVYFDEQEIKELLGFKLDEK